MSSTASTTNSRVIQALILRVPSSESTALLARSSPTETNLIMRYRVNSDYDNNDCDNNDYDNNDSDNNDCENDVCDNDVCDNNDL